MKKPEQAPQYTDAAAEEASVTAKLPSGVSAFFTTLKNKVADTLNDEKKSINFLVLIGAAGMLLLALSEWIPSKTDAKPVQLQAESSVITPAQYADTLQRNLEEILGQVDGAGRVEAMVTLENTETTVYARNTQSQTDGSASQTYAEIASQPLCQTTQMPAVQGVAIVCDGGDDARLAYQLTNMAAALTGIGTNRIVVAKRAADPP